MASALLYLGTHSHVAAFDRATGAELWRTKLKNGLVSDGFVTLLVHDDRLFAHTSGELFCLDAQTGAIQWNNRLAGLGYDLASLAVNGAPGAPASAVAAAQLHTVRIRTSAITTHS